MYTLCSEPFIINITIFYIIKYVRVSAILKESKYYAMYYKRVPCIVLYCVMHNVLKEYYILRECCVFKKSSLNINI
jgi:hypothetical protein